MLVAFKEGSFCFVCFVWLAFANPGFLASRLGFSLSFALFYSAASRLLGWPRDSLASWLPGFDSAYLMTHSVLLVVLQLLQVFGQK